MNQKELKEILEKMNSNDKRLLLSYLISKGAKGLEDYWPFCSSLCCKY